MTQPVPPPDSPQWCFSGVQNTSKEVEADARQTNPLIETALKVYEKKNHIQFFITIEQAYEYENQYVFKNEEGEEHSVTYLFITEFLKKLDHDACKYKYEKIFELQKKNKAEDSQFIPIKLVGNDSVWIEEAEDIYRLLEYSIKIVKI
jgi:hypothetical protein